MDEESCVPPGFRFHPTEEELVGYYLARKVASQKIDLEVIQEVNLYRIEPWELQERCKDGHYDQEEQTEWYFFSYKDRKYPSGTRTNRATAAGFWKATGRDKPVVSKCKVIGMRKTLVFYKGRAPNGLKTDWIIHEYRLQSTENEPTQEEGWVVCRAFKKPSNAQRPNYNSFRQDNNDNTNYYENAHYIGYMQTYFQEGHSEEEVECKIKAMDQQHLEIPQLECSPSLRSSRLSTRENFEGNYVGSSIEINASAEGNSFRGEFVDWKLLDKLLLSQSSNYYELSSSSSVPVNDYDAGGEIYPGYRFDY